MAVYRCRHRSREAAWIAGAASAAPANTRLAEQGGPPTTGSASSRSSSGAAMPASPRPSRRVRTARSIVSCASSAGCGTVAWHCRCASAGTSALAPAATDCGRCPKTLRRLNLAPASQSTGACCLLAGVTCGSRSGVTKARGDHPHTFCCRLLLFYRPPSRPAKGPPEIRRHTSLAPEGSPQPCAAQAVCCCGRCCSRGLPARPWWPPRRRAAAASWRRAAAPSPAPWLRPLSAALQPPRSRRGALGWRAPPQLPMQRRM